MLLRFLSRRQWEAKLRAAGAEPLEGKTALNTAEWWRVPKRPPFVVPVEDDGRAEFWAIQKLLSQLRAKTVFNPDFEDEDE